MKMKRNWQSHQKLSINAFENIDVLATMDVSVQTDL